MGTKASQSFYHWSEIRVEEDVAVVVDGERVAVDAQLQDEEVRHLLRPHKLTLSGGVSLSISSMGTSVPATPNSSAILTCGEALVAGQGLGRDFACTS